MLIDNPLRAVRISQQILITRTTRWQRRLSLSVAWYTIYYNVQGQPDNLFEELALTPEDITNPPYSIQQQCTKQWSGTWRSGWNRCLLLAGHSMTRPRRCPNRHTVYGHHWSTTKL